MGTSVDPVRSRSLAFALAAVVLFAGSTAVAHRVRIADDEPYDVAFIPSVTSLRWMSLGHSTLAANLLWLRAVQYMGEPRADERGWDKLRPLVEVVTDLDPRHGYAYQTTANILSYAGHVADSNALLEKGMRNVPDRYILPFHRAVNAFLYEGDYAEAGRWFELAARTPGARPHIREYVVAMYAKGNSADAAVSFLERLRAEAEDEESRTAIERQIKRARLEGGATQLEDAVEAYRAWLGVRPVVPEQLVFAGVLSALPPDPFGGIWYFDSDGRARSTAFGERYARPLTGPERARELQRSRALVREHERSLR